MTSRPSAAELIRRAVALLALISLLAGVPVALWILGGAYLPHEIPTLGQVDAALLGPDTGAVFAGLLVVIGWAAWAVFTLSVCLELPAQLRGLPAPRLPGLGSAQRLAGLIVAGILGMGSPVFAVPPQAAAVPVTAPALPVPAVVDSTGVEPMPFLPRTFTDRTAPEAPPGPRYTVQPRDTLGRIAARYLGDWERFDEIFELNRGLPQPDGRELTDARVIRPGWQLVLPADAAPQPTKAQVVVRPGDTLAEIADHEGLPSWRPIFDLNVGEPQPGGHRFTDPDLILPGQVLDIPAAATPAMPHVPSRPPEPSVPQASPPAPPSRTPSAPQPTTTPDSPAAPTPAAGSALSDSSAPARTVAPRAGDAADTSAADAVALLGGAGALLAAGIATTLLFLRRQRLRRRRTGRQLAALPPRLVRTETAVRTAAAEGQADFVALDLALRSLAVALSDVPGGQLPDVVAARLAGHLLELRLHAAVGAPPPPPWVADETGQRWSLDLRADNPIDRDRARGRLAPYPALVSVGSQDSDRWLLDLERIGVLQLEGPSARREDFCRHLAAELAVNRWSDLVFVQTAGFGAELADLNPERLTPVEDAEPAAAALSDELRDTTEGGEIRRGAVLDGRLHATAGNGWMPTVLLAPLTPATGTNLSSLVSAVHQHDDRSALAVVLAAESTNPRDGWHLALTGDGAIVIPELDLTLQACQLTATDGADIAALMAFERTAGDVPLAAAAGGPPPHAPTGSPADGGRHIGPRVPGAPGPPATPWPTPTRQRPAGTDGPAPDSTPTQNTVVTLGERRPRDLSRGADGDPDQLNPDPLDRDLAEWWSPDCSRPRLTLLGPIRLRAHGNERAATKTGLRRRCEEFVAYLTTRPNGATVQEAAAALRPDLTDPISARTHVHRVAAGARAWLGVDPATGEQHLGSRRGGPSTLRNVLVDAELFGRLRARASTRGPEGRADLLAALDLVAGPPFGQRPPGYEWLQGLDLGYTAAVCDIAHQVVTTALADGDLAVGRAASAAALLVAPDDENILLDAMWIAFRDGNRAEAETFVARIVEVNDGEDEMDLHLSTAEAIARARREFAGRSAERRTRRDPPAG